LSTLIIAFVADERTLAGMRALVQSERAASRTSIIAFVAGVRTLAGMHALVIN
jgi:hypothetical protein